MKQCPNCGSDRIQKWIGYTCLDCHQEYNTAWQGWISVKDRLPTIDDGEVLAYVDGGGCFIEYIKTAPNDQTGWTVEQFAKTFDYWMPLPEPPEEVEG